jgi:hypothetical protein
MEGYLLHYKNENNEWVPIPVSIRNVYDAYVAYCEKNEIGYVTETEYYAALADVKATLTELKGLLGNAESMSKLEALIATLKDGVLPLERGGTGASIGDDVDSDYATICAFLLDNLGFGKDGTVQTLPQRFATLSESITSLSTNKLDKTSISSGIADPTDSTSGTYYFQYEA